MGLSVSSRLSSTEVKGLIPCWNCDEKKDDPHLLFCGTCGKVQRIDEQEVDYFDLFGVERAFNVDLKALDASFKNIQRVLHPDKFATLTIPEREASASSSSVVNQAYQALKAPMGRARYLLRLYGYNYLEEGAENTFDDPSLMMEMFEIREKVSECFALEQIKEIKAEMEAETEAVCQDMQVHMQAGEVGRDELAVSAVRLQYLSKVTEEVEMKEEQLRLQN